MALPNTDINGLPPAPNISAEDKFAMYSITRGRTEAVTAEQLIGAGTTPNTTWTSGHEYSEGDVVLWGDEFYVSDEDSNVGNNPGVPGSTFWHVVSKSPSNTDWQAGVYTDPKTIVYYLDPENKYHALRLKNGVSIPYNSTNLKNEYIAGDWIRIEAAMVTMSYKFDASVNSYPPDTVGSGPSGIILQGNCIFVDEAGTDGDGNDLFEGMMLIALEDQPGNDGTKWKRNAG